MKWQKCPVCGGTGLVSRPPWVAADQSTFTSSSAIPRPCPTCCGVRMIPEPRKENDLTFEEWYHEVDKEVERVSGLSVVDLADQEYNTWFEAGIEPKDAAVMVLRAEGWED